MTLIDYDYDVRRGNGFVGAKIYPKILIFFNA